MRKWILIAALVLVGVAAFLFSNRPQPQAWVVIDSYSPGYWVKVYNPATLAETVNEMVAANTRSHPEDTEVPETISRHATYVSHGVFVITTTTEGTP
jgi:hypothetical protein